MRYLFGEMIMLQEVAEVIPEFHFGGWLIPSTSRASLVRCGGVSSPDSFQSETLLSPESPHSPKTSPEGSPCEASSSTAGRFLIRFRKR